MAMISEWVKIDAVRMADSFSSAGERLSTADGELVLDFSSIQRIDSGALASLSQLSEAAEQKNVRLVLRGTNIDIYRVLKLARIDTRFTFAN